jgi:NAD(P)-dependent dehydrogenase (short-subunit alcohol dehydrogenase family)
MPDKPENPLDFKDRCVLLTGAAGNLGRALAAAFAARGAQLALVDLKREALEKAYGAENERRLLAPANLLEQREVDAAVRAVLARFGRIDVLVNVAGGFRMGEAVHETSDATWNFLFDLNARSLLHAARAVVPHMLAAGGGKVVNIGAFAAQRGGAHMGAYAAAKSAVIRLTESMAAELREKNVNVNCVLPTIIDTPENRAAMPAADPARWVAPADLANVILFLASDAARAVHGAALPVTGLS